MAILSAAYQPRRTLVKMVSARYYRCMESSRALHLLERISSLLRSELRKSSAAGLEPVHFAALGYLARANRFSANPLAVAEYLGLTKGNVSQRLMVLERKGLLRKTAGKEDRRTVRLQLTPRGRAVLGRVAPPPADAALERALDRLLRRILAANGGRTFGQCHTCRFHQTRNGAPYCGLLQLPLTRAEADQICREHEPAGAA